MSLSKCKNVAHALNELREYNMCNSVDANGIAKALGDYFMEDGSGTDTDSATSDCEIGTSDTDDSSDDVDETLADIVSRSLVSDSALEETTENVGYGYAVNHTDDEDVDLPLITDEMPMFELEMGKIAVSEDVEKETQHVRMFNCKCQKAREGQCIKQFNIDWILRTRRNMQELSQNDKDLVIMTKLSCSINLSQECVTNKSKEKQRSHPHTKYFVESKSVCRAAFKFLHVISQNKLTACINWYKEHGLCPRQKRSGGKVYNTNSLAYEDIERIAFFLTNFAEKHALVLPGRVPGFKRPDIKLLPSSETKTSVWRKYSKAVTDQGYRAAKLTTFKETWKQLMPHIVITKPMTDLCNECQKNNHAVYRSANLPEIVKSAKLKKQEHHLQLVNQERDVYRSMVSQAKEDASKLAIQKLDKNDECSRPIRMHYSFDFAQQVHFPHSPYQPGPLYFLTPRKCAVFGICCEALPQQMNYLIDEGMSASKGSNAVISYLHHFFGHYGLGEENCDLHCDNCSGQNKNKFVLWYLLWRTLHGLHKEISLNFLISGHTKFAPDWCFGLLKQKYRRTEINTLSDLASTVESSTTRMVNRAQLTGNENGQVDVNSYDWQQFFSPYFKALPAIKTFHRMRFSSQHPGIVFVKENSSTQETAIQLLKDTNIIPPRRLPHFVPAPGLDEARRTYLFTKIRDFCTTEESKDIVCPRPNFETLETKRTKV